MDLNFSQGEVDPRLIQDNSDSLGRALLQSDDLNYADAVERLQEDGFDINNEFPRQRHRRRHRDGPHGRRARAPALPRAVDAVQLLRERQRDVPGRTGQDDRRSRSEPGVRDLLRALQPVGRGDRRSEQGDYWLVIPSDPDEIADFDPNSPDATDDFRMALPSITNWNPGESLIVLLGVAASTTPCPAGAGRGRGSAPSTPVGRLFGKLFAETTTACSSRRGLLPAALLPPEEALGPRARPRS